MNSNNSDLVAILTDYDQRHAPLDGRAIRLSLTADVMFIESGQVVEKYDSKTSTSTTIFTSNETVGVDAELLLHTLIGMIRRDDRMNFDRAKESKLPFDHPSSTTVPMTVAVPAVTRRA